MTQSKNGVKPFDLPLREVTLNFEGKYKGVVMNCHLDVPMGLVLDMQEMAERIKAGEDLSAVKIRESFQRFARDVLTKWNVRVNGHDIPATEEGIMQVPPAFVIDLIQTWAKATGTDDVAPLPETASA